MLLLRPNFHIMARAVSFLTLSFLTLESTVFAMAAEEYHGHISSITTGLQAFEALALEKRSLLTNAELLRFPLSRWTLPNIEHATAMDAISRGTSRRHSFPYELRADVDTVAFTLTNSDERMTFAQALNETHTDGVMVIHDGVVVYEKYSGNFDSTKRHLACSVTKSFIGLIGAMLVENKTLNVDAFVQDVVPLLKTSAFAGATIGQLLNMETSLKYSETYADPNADIWKFLMAGNMLPRPHTYAGPTTLLSFLTTTEKDPAIADHGQGFRYKTPNTDALALVIETVLNKPIGTVISEMLWQHLGAEHDAMISIDSEGRHFAGAGLATTLPDLGRFAEMIRNDGYFNGTTIVQKAVIDDIKQNGNVEAFKTSGFDHLEGTAYHKHWWTKDGILMARGTFGQFIFIDQMRKISIVKYSSAMKASNSYTDHILLPAFGAVASYLANHPLKRSRL